MGKTLKTIGIAAIFSLIALAAACGGGTAGGTEAKTIAEKKVSENLTVTLSGADGKLKNGEQEIGLAFTDGAGKPVEIKAAALNFNMPAMGSMAEMNSASALKTTDTPGHFTGTVKIDMAGEWIAQISYEGVETGKTTIATTAY